MLLSFQSQPGVVILAGAGLLALHFAQINEE